MAKIIMTAQGLDGIMLLMNDRVVIDRKGIWNFFKYGSSAKREIPLSAVSEVIFKKATMVTIGEIEMVRAGNSSDDKRAKKNVNPNVLKIRKNRQKEFEAIKEKIFEMMNQNARR